MLIERTSSFVRFMAAGFFLAAMFAGQGATAANVALKLDGIALKSEFTFSNPAQVGVPYFAGIDTTCLGSPVATSITWNNPNAVPGLFAATNGNVTGTPSAGSAGSYTYTGTQAASPGCAASSVIAHLTVLPAAPTCTVSQNPPPPTDRNVPVTLTATCTDNPTSFVWAVQNGATLPSTANNVVVTPIVSTTYTVRATNAGGTGPATAYRVVVQPLTPTCTISQSPPGAVNSGTPVTLTPNCTNVTDGTFYSWTVGGVQIATTRILAVAPTQTTTYNLAAENPGGVIGFSQATVTVIPAAPSGCVITPTPVSLGVGGGQVSLAVACSSGGAPAAYEWTGNGLVSTTGNPVIANITQTTTFNVKVSNAGGSVNASAVTVPVAVAAPSGCSIAAAPASLPAGGGQVTLTASCTGGGTPDANGYTWTGPGMPQGKTGAVVATNLTATADFTMTASNSGGTSSPASFKQVVVAAPAPSGCVITPTPVSLGIGGGQVSLAVACSSGGAPTAYEWTGNGLVSTAGNPVIANITQTTAFNVKVSNGSGSVNAPAVTVAVSVAAPANCSIAAAPASLPIGGGTVTLTASCAAGGAPDANGYTWTGPGMPQGKTGAVVTANIAATADFTMTASNSGGTSSPASLKQVVVAVAAPSGCTITPTPASLPVGGGSVSLNATCASGGAPTSYTWTGTGLQSTTGNPVTATIAQSTTFSVKIGNAAGDATAQQNVAVAAPVASVIAFVSGSPQAGDPGRKLAQPLVVKVLDNLGKPFAAAEFVIPPQITGGTGTLALLKQDPVGTYQFDFVLGSETTTRTVYVCLKNAPTACIQFTVTTTAAVNALIGPQAIAAITAPAQQLANIQQRLDNLRTARNPTVTQGLKVSYDGQPLPSLSAFALAPLDKDGKPIAQKGGGASGDKDPFERWGVFVQGDLDIGKQDGTSTQAAFDIHTKGLTVGADYRFAGGHVAGMALGLVKATTDLSNNSGNQDTKGWSFSLFGEYVPVPNAYIDLALTYGQNKYDTTRKATDSTQPSAQSEFNSSPRGSQFGVSLTAGYQFYHQAFTLTPYGRVEYIDASIDAFQENGGTGALSISSQRYKSTVLTLGGQAQYAWSLSWGVLVPYVRAEYQYAAQGTGNTITAQYAVPPAGTGNDPVSFQTSLTDKNFGNLAVGATAVLPRGFSGYFNYQYLFGKENFGDSRYTLGIRFDF